MISLLYYASKRKVADLEFQASLHGHKLDKDKIDLPKDKKEPDKFVFGSEDSYKNMSDEERKKLTEEMKSRHQIWAGKPKGT